jgi:hypothetical protein
MKNIYIVFVPQRYLRCAASSSRVLIPKLQELTIYILKTWYMIDALFRLRTDLLRAIKLRRGFESRPRHECTFILLMTILPSPLVWVLVQDLYAYIKNMNFKSWEIARRIERIREIRHEMSWENPDNMSGLSYLWYSTVNSIICPYSEMNIILRNL